VWARRALIGSNWWASGRAERAVGAGGAVATASGAAAGALGAPDVHGRARAPQEPHLAGGGRVDRVEAHDRRSGGRRCSLGREGALTVRTSTPRDAGSSILAFVVQTLKLQL
jgi:hypothetical protein